MYQPGKILQTSNFANLTLQHAKEAFPDIYSSPPLKLKLRLRSSKQFLDKAATKLGRAVT